MHGARIAEEDPQRGVGGHRGSGKTSVNEALLFERARSTGLARWQTERRSRTGVRDEKSREMSISASLSSFRWDDRKINLIDTPGEPSFIADALAALRVVEGAVFVVTA